MGKRIGAFVSDGLIHGLVFCVLMDFALSRAAKGNDAAMMTCCFLGIAIASALSFVFFKREKPVPLFLIEVGSICVSAAVIVLLTLLRIQYGFSFFSVSDLPDAAGFMLVAMFWLFVFVSIMGRIIIYLIILSRNIARREVL